jgi:hypothetical protein
MRLGILTPIGWTEGKKDLGRLWGDDAQLTENVAYMRISREKMGGFQTWTDDFYVRTGDFYPPSGDYYPWTGVF